MQDDDRLYELVMENGSEDVVLFWCRYWYDMISFLIKSDFDVLNWRVMVYEGSKQNPIERLPVGIFISEHMNMYKKL